MNYYKVYHNNLPYKNSYKIHDSCNRKITYTDSCKFLKDYQESCVFIFEDLSFSYTNYIAKFINRNLNSLYNCFK